jgi:hypothetical protein
LASIYYFLHFFLCLNFSHFLEKKFIRNL